MLKFITKFILFTIAVYLTAYFVPGIHLEGIKNTIIVSVVLGFLNTFVKPFVKILTFPVNMLTLGLFTIVINALMLILCEVLVPDSLSLDGYLPALIYGVTLVVVSWLLNFIFLHD